MASHGNFYPAQYQADNQQAIKHNYLQQQFEDPTPILDQIKDLVLRGDFTLGEVVDEFERVFAERCGVQHGIGVGSGTDALFLALKAAGVQAGDEVITTPYTFYATISAITRNGAKPVFVDIGDDYNIDASQIPQAITSKTKALLPVHWAGSPYDFDQIKEIAQTYDLPIIADACHAIDAEYKQQPIGHLADISCFSLHPLKNLNVWGDGGVVVTQNPDISDRIKCLRNHGLKDRDTCEAFAYNSRLDSLQAIVAHHLIQYQLEKTTHGRINNAQVLKQAFEASPNVQLPNTCSDNKHVYHLFMAEYSQRDQLKRHLNQAGIDAKIHYPTPMHLQPAARYLKHKLGDFPRSESLAKSCLSLPVHEFLTPEDLERMVDEVHKFYGED